jgi:hypothetical protein
MFHKIQHVYNLLTRLYLYLYSRLYFLSTFLFLEAHIKTLSVHPSIFARVGTWEWPNGFSVTLKVASFTKLVDTFHFWSKSDKNNGHCISWPIGLCVSELRKDWVGISPWGIPSRRFPGNSQKLTVKFWWTRQNCLCIRKASNLLTGLNEINPSWGAHVWRHVSYENYLKCFMKFL